MKTKLVCQYCNPFSDTYLPVNILDDWKYCYKIVRHLYLPHFTLFLHLLHLQPPHSLVPMLLHLHPSHFPLSLHLLHVHLHHPISSFLPLVRFTPTPFPSVPLLPLFSSSPPPNLPVAIVLSVELPVLSSISLPENNILFLVCPNFL